MTAKFSPGDLCIIIKTRPEFSHLIGTACTINEVLGNATIGDVLEVRGRSVMCRLTGIYYDVELNTPIMFNGSPRNDAAAPEEYLMKISPDKPKSKNIVEKKLKVY